MNTMQKQTIAAFHSGFLIFGLVGVLSWGLISSWLMLNSDGIVPGVTIHHQPMGRLLPQQAQQQLEQNLPTLSNFTLILTDQDRSWSTSSAELGWHQDIATAVDQAHQIGRQGNWSQQLAQRLQLLWQPVDIEVASSLDPHLVTSWVASVSAQVDQPGEAPQITVTKYDYQLNPGVVGQVVDQPTVVSHILHDPHQTQFPLVWNTVHQPLREDEIKLTQQRLQQLWPKKIQVTVSPSEPSFTLSATDFFPWLALPTGVDTKQVQAQLEKWNTQYQREPQNAQLEITDDLKVTAFEPPQEGRSLNQSQVQSDLVAALTELEDNPASKEATLTLSFQTVEPDVPLSATNSLGINELIGLGTSTYFGSIANRVYNVNLTSSRLNATLVPPGEEFSFNRAVGDISAKTGYRTAYVIRNGRTELGDGGGVCQVSTTTFRAALDAGLPITAWKAHSYRVGYYEQNSQPGFDATVYSPSTDFRFKNDTGHYILVSSQADTDNRFLKVELWGTSDGRQSEISHYTLGNFRPAPAPLYQEDPSLPPGTKKQIDWAAAGATASFEYQVTTATGEPLYKRTFRSVYQPWQAVYLVGPTQ